MREIKKKKEGRGYRDHANTIVNTGNINGLESGAGTVCGGIITGRTRPARYDVKGPHH